MDGMVELIFEAKCQDADEFRPICKDLCTRENSLIHKAMLVTTCVIFEKR